MKKIALVTCYFQHNYGSMLQAYATQKFFTDKGYTVENICINRLMPDIKARKYKYYMSNIRNFSLFKSKMYLVKDKLLQKLFLKSFGDNMNIRGIAFERFMQKFILSKECDFNELSGYIKQFDAVVVGSDQLWLPSNISADYYTLNWVPNNVVKISYATSFGVSTLDSNMENMTKGFLSRFSYISVREDAGKSIIDRCGLDAEVVCDPTLLFGKVEWDKVRNKDHLIKEDYIFCYLIGKNKVYLDEITQFAKQKGLKIVTLKYIDGYSSMEKSFGDIELYDVDPSQFINLIADSKYVITDSFHCTVFSILYKKSFMTYPRFKVGSKNSTNSRIETLLNNLELNERYLLNSNINSIDVQINYDKVDDLIEKIKNKSLEFLDKALG